MVQVNDIISRVSHVVDANYQEEKLKAVKANRTDFNGNPLDSGKWTAQDFDGKYHKSRIDNPFPIPGTALAVDQFRDDMREDMLAHVVDRVDEAGRQAKIRAHAKEMKVNK